MTILKDVRENAQIKQAQLAKLLGISDANYSKKENGSVKFSLQEAKTIADFFGMTITDIFFADEVSNNDIP